MNANTETLEAFRARLPAGTRVRRTLGGEWEYGTVLGARSTKWEGVGRPGPSGIGVAEPHAAIRWDGEPGLAYCVKGEFSKAPKSAPPRLREGAHSVVATRAVIS
jgi:hypothetical protein